LALSRVVNEAEYLRKRRRIRIAEHVAESFEVYEGSISGPCGLVFSHGAAF
jgi:hypothetical protein